MADLAVNPYGTAAPLFGGKPSWVTDPTNVARLQAYNLYERIYWLDPNVFAKYLRGTDDVPTDMPTAQTIVDTVNRYTAPKFDVTVFDRTDETDITADVQAARIAIRDFMTREKFKAKLAAAKRYSMIQGDWVWHITADATKEIGSRISVVSLDPSLYFPQPDEDDITSIRTVFLAWPIAKDGKDLVQRITYRKTDQGAITVEEGIFAIDQWEKDDASPSEKVRDLTTLPPEITTIPVYHIKNRDVPGLVFGSSELRGYEKILAKIVQTMSDEDLTLVMDGLGMYETDAPRPIDPQTNKETNWKAGPGQVWHHPPGTRVGRISGAGSVVPYGDHYKRLNEALRRAAATADVAVGEVDATIASSGVALALQLSPTISKGQEKELEILGVHEQMFFDILTMWYAAYEDTVFANVYAVCTGGDALPVDRASRFQELNDMLDRRVISTKYYRREVAALGYDFPDDDATMDEDIAADIAREDATSQRLATAAAPVTDPTAGADLSAGVA